MHTWHAFPGQWKIQTRLKHCPCFREACKLGKETDTQKIALNTRTQRVIKVCRSTGQDIGGKKLSFSIVFLGKKMQPGRGSWALYSPSSFNMAWGGSLGTSPRKTWRVLVDTVDSLECATSCLLTLACPFVNTYIDSQIGSVSSWQGHRNVFLDSSLLLFISEVLEPWFQLLTERL